MATLQTIPILYLFRRHGWRSHVSAREAWARDLNEASEQEPCEHNLAHDINSWVWLTDERSRFARGGVS